MLRNDLAPALSLDGEWRFVLGDGPESTIHVPGCWEAQGFPKTVDGPAHYQRSIDVPANWAGERILIEFDAVSYACVVRINGAVVGEHKGMWTPFSFDVSNHIRPGESNEIALEMYKPGERYPMRSSLAGFLPDVATIFGGIWQSCRLRAVPVALVDLLVDTDPATGRIHVHCGVDSSQLLHDAQLHAVVSFHNESVASASVAVQNNVQVDVTLSLDQVHLWSPADPALYDIQIALQTGEQIVAQAHERVGFRTLAAVGEQVQFNGHPVILRGALSWGWDPDMIAPAWSDETIRAEIRRVRELGFNLIKLCLVVPDQRYYNIADEEGIFLWQEWPMWLPKVTPEMRAQAPGEYADLMRLTRQHPSVVLYSVGCELNASVDAELLGRLDAIVRVLSAGVLVCDNSGSGEAYGGLPFDFADFADYHTYGDIHHFEPILDNWLRGWQAPRPWIFGETCDSDGFRDLDELIAANGGAKPWWMTEDVQVHTWRPEVQALLVAKERLAQSQPGFGNQELVAIATQQSLMIRKFWLEALRRRPATGGYVITGLRDTPIATSGVFDDFWRPKGTPEQYRAFNDDTVLSLDVGRRRRWLPEGERVEPLDRHCVWANTPMRWHVILSHVAPNDVHGTLQWRLVRADGSVVARGESRAPRPVPPGVPREAGVIDVLMPNVREAESLRLEASFDTDSVAGSNSWPVWVFPQPTRWPRGLVHYDPTATLESLELAQIAGSSLQLDKLDPSFVIITNLLTNDVQEYLRNGGRVLLIQHGNGPLPVRRTSFWREALKLFPDHPLWTRFPVAGFADMQFFGLATDASIIASRINEVLPDATDIRPIMRRLDARYFDISEYLVEARVGAGRLLACTLRLQGGAGGQPWGPRRQVAGHFMLWALLQELEHGGS